MTNHGLRNSLNHNLSSAVEGSRETESNARKSLSQSEIRNVLGDQRERIDVVASPDANPSHWFKTSKSSDVK